jgi:hypothetical protein
VEFHECVQWYLFYAHRIAYYVAYLVICFLWDSKWETCANLCCIRLVIFFGPACCSSFQMSATNLFSKNQFPCIKYWMLLSHNNGSFLIMLSTSYNYHLWICCLFHILVFLFIRSRQRTDGLFVCLLILSLIFHCLAERQYLVIEVWFVLCVVSMFYLCVTESHCLDYFLWLSDLSTKSLMVFTLLDLLLKSFCESW